MQTKLTIILFGIFSVLLIACSILLPLYFLKWKDSSTSKSLAAGLGTPVVVEIQVPWLYAYFFSNPFNTANYISASILPFGTNQQGIAYSIDPIGIMTNSTINATSSSNFNSLSNPTYPTPSTIQSFFTKQVSGIATQSQITSYISSLQASSQSPMQVTSTAGRGSFYLSDDKSKLLVGKITSTGEFVPVLPNISLNYDITRIPDTFFVTGLSTFGITDYVDTQAFNTSYGPVINGVGNLNSSATLFATEDPNSGIRNSNTFFIYRVPLVFNSAFWAQFKSNTTNGLVEPFGYTKSTVNNVVTEFSFSQVVTSLATVFKPGWSLATQAEATAAFQTSTFYNFNTNPTLNTSFKLVLANNGIVSLFNKNNTGANVITKNTTPFSYTEFVTASVHWLVKSVSPLTTMPTISDVMDLNITMGMIGNISPATSSTTPQPAPGNGQLISSNGSQTAMMTPDGMVFSTPKSSTFLQKNGLAIYITTGLVVSCAVIVGILYWQSHRADGKTESKADSKTESKADSKADSKTPSATPTASPIAEPATAPSATPTATPTPNKTV